MARAGIWGVASEYISIAGNTPEPNVTGVELAAGTSPVAEKNTHKLQTCPFTGDVTIREV